jgi:nucleotide-binding universal stress UspA family protein
VVGVDGTSCALDAVRWAVDEARRRGIGLTIVHAAPYASGSEGFEAQRVRQILAVAYTVAHRAAPAVAVSTTSSPARPAEALAAAADAAPLLVLGIPTDSSYEILPTSVALDVAGRASCPVTVVRGRLHTHDGPVLAGIEDPVADAAVLDLAFCEAALHGNELVVLQAHGWLSEHRAGPVADAERITRLTTALAPWSELHPQVKVTVSTPHEDPTTALLAAAHQAKLLVVGAHRSQAAARVLFGSHSRAMLRHSPVPVLVVSPNVRSATRRVAAIRTIPAEQT